MSGAIALRDVIQHAGKVTGAVPYLAYSRDEIEAQEQKLDADPEFQKRVTAFADAEEEPDDDTTARGGRRWLVSTLSSEDYPEFADCVTVTREFDGRTFVFKHAFDWRLSDRGIEDRVADGVGLVCDNFDMDRHDEVQRLQIVARRHPNLDLGELPPTFDEWRARLEYVDALDDLRAQAKKDLSGALAMAVACEFADHEIASIVDAAKGGSMGSVLNLKDYGPLTQAALFKRDRMDPNKETYLDENGDFQRRDKPKLATVCAASLAGKAVPERKWIVKDWIPDRNVTLLSGDGAVGKSLTALQLAVAVAHTGVWLGMPVASGPAVYFSAEDETDEIHRRLADICEAAEINMADLTDLHIVPLAGRDALLATLDKNKRLVPTPLWGRLVERVEHFEAKLVIIDTSADVFGGSEIDRTQVRAFIGQLRGMGLDYDLGLVLLSHPSVAGMATGSGMSGSTGWNNSVRSRLYQEQVIVRDSGVESEPDPDLRTLKTKKVNYGRRDNEIRFRWVRGVFVREETGEPRDRNSEHAYAEAAFMDLLRLLDGQDRHVNPSNGSKDYAPAVFAKHPKNGGVRQPAFKAAMERLFEAGRIVKGYTPGPPSRRKEKICVGTDAEKPEVLGI